MKNTLLLFAVPVALLSLGMAQTPAPVAMTNTAATIKGCIGGTDGAFTIAQDGSAQSLKIASSSVDLKAHIGHQVELTGQKSSAAVSGSPDTVSVTGVSMISEHCPTTAAATSAPSDPSTATLSAPAPAATVSAAAPAASAPPVTTPAAAAVTTPAASTPSEPVAATTPAQTATAPVVMASSKEALPNTPAPSLKAVKVTGNVGADGKTFVSDKDSKSWAITNPDAVKGHEGHHVTLTAHVDAVKSEVNVVSLKMAK